MKTGNTPESQFLRPRCFIFIGVFLFVAAAVAVPILSAHSSSLDRSGDQTSSTTEKTRAKISGLSGRYAHSNLPLPTAQSSPETIQTFAADCSTAKSSFYLGEKVCAKTNSVTLPPADNWWVNWILLNNDGAFVVYGGDGVTNVTMNPQTFTYTPTAVGSYKVSLTNLPNDISQTPAGFTVVDAPSVSTYTSDCSQAKSDFNLNQTMCIKVRGISDFGRKRLQVSEPDGFILFSSDLTDNSQDFSYQIPSAATQTYNGEALDHRGTWVVAVAEKDDAGLVEIAPVVVHKSNLLIDRVADLQLSKVWLGDPVEAGLPVTFQIFVFNQGPDPATNITLTDVTLPNTTFSSFSQGGLLGSMPNSGFGSFSGDNADFGGNLVRFVRDPASDLFHNPSLLSLSPINTVTFNCTLPPVGSPGTTTCTANAELAPGESAVFTAVYTVNANLPSGADLTDPNSASVTSSTADQHESSNTSGTSLTSGNSNPASCSLTCPGNVTATADTVENVDGVPTSGAHVTFSSAESSGDCGTLTASTASGSFFPVGSTPVTVTSSGGASCTFLVTVTSSGSPVTISCPAAVTTNAGANCNATVSLGTPTTTGDNVTVTSTRSDGGAQNAPFQLGVTTVTWTASNSSGTASCTQTVTVNDVTPPVITATDQTVSADANCQAAVPDYRNSASDNCACAGNDNSEICQTRDDIIVSQSVAAGTLVGLGPHTITLTATDEANNVATKTITFTVADTTPPTFTFVPGAITAYTGAGATTCDTSVDPGTATASDNCGTVNVTRSPSGNTFPVGTNTITWTATDGAGNTATATQTITVIDNTPPVISCPANLTVYLPLNTTATSMAVNYPAASASDNCGSPSVAYSKASGSVFNIGTSTVTATATDTHGNSASCTFTVTVLYDFTGFFSPVGNPPVLNAVNAGRAVPVKFSLSGGKGLNIFAANNPYTVSLNCATNDPGVDVAETLTAGGSSLSYSPDTYNYVWKTDSSWAGTCRQLVVTLNDGSVHVANFKFK